MRGGEPEIKSMDKTIQGSGESVKFFCVDITIQVIGEEGGVSWNP